MSDSVRSRRWQPTRLPRPWDSPGKNIGLGCHFLLQCMKAKSESEVTQSCPTLSDPMDCSLPGSSIHGIFQARVLEWGAIAFYIYITIEMISSQVVLVVTNPPANAGDISNTGSIPGSRRFPGEGQGYPLQYSCLEHPTDRGAWWTTVHGVAKSRTRLSN